MASNLLRECMKKGFLLDREMLELFGTLEEKKAKDMIDVLSGLGINERVITKKVFSTNLDKIQASLVRYSGGDEVDNFFNGFLGVTANIKIDGLNDISRDLNEGKDRPKVKLINAPAFPQRKITVNDFVKHFRSRYEQIRQILEAQDYDDLTTIRKIGQNKGSYTIIASVVEKRTTKNKNVMITVEDLTGTSTILVNQNKEEIFEKASKLLNDDIVAFSVTGNSDLLFCNDLHFPDSGLLQKRRHDEDVWIAFISDLHCGSVNFLENDILRFVKWINGGNSKSKYNDISKKIKYLFVVGDLVDGVNHYPGQDKELNILTCRGQYKKFEEIIRLIRKDIEIVICPGNHDAVWVGEPQPIISDKWAPGLYEMDNVHLVPNPALVEIDGDFKILMYHGAALNAFVEEIPEIRTKYGRNSPTVMVKEMIKRRHLAPMHGLVDYIPCEVDPMVINPVPDIIVTGDLHTVDVSMQNNILLIASSCWQSITPFMEKVGVNPDPGKVPLFNLKTREVKILDFSADSHEVEWVTDEKIICKINDSFYGSNING